MNNFIHLARPDKETLVFFLHAGATPAQYINFCKENSFHEHFDIYIYCKSDTKKWAELVREANIFIASLGLKKLKVFGHSMGALLALEASTAFPTLDIDLYLSAMNVPSKQALANYSRLANLELHPFIGEVMKFGGIPEILVKDNKLLETFSLQIHNDFKLLATIPSKILELKTHHSVKLLIGIQDKLTNLNMITQWKEFCNGPIGLKAFPGNHFYLFESSDQVQAYLVDQK